MATEFSGRPTEQERAEATELNAWSVAEKLTVIAVLGLGVGAGAILPLWQGEFVFILPLSLCAVCMAVLTGTYLRRRELVKSVLAEPIEGVSDGNLLKVRSGDSAPLLIDLSTVGSCRVGRDALVVWSRNSPVVISSSLLTDPVEWARLRSLVEISCNRTLRIRRVVLVGSLVAWLVVLTVAWTAWGQ